MGVRPYKLILNWFKELTHVHQHVAHCFNRIDGMLVNLTAHVGQKAKLNNETVVMEIQTTSSSVSDPTGVALISLQYESGLWKLFYVIKSEHLLILITCEWKLEIVIHFARYLYFHWLRAKSLIYRNYDLGMQLWRHIYSHGDYTCPGHVELTCHRRLLHNSGSGKEITKFPRSLRGEKLQTAVMFSPKLWNNNNNNYWIQFSHDSENYQDLCLWNLPNISLQLWPPIIRGTQQQHFPVVVGTSF